MLKLVVFLRILLLLFLKVRLLLNLRVLLFKNKYLYLHMFCIIQRNMNDSFSKVWTWIKSLPVWLRAVVLVLVSALVLIFSVSCGPTVRVSARTTSDSVTVSVYQNVVDSTGVSVSVNPNININPKTF